jgi:RNA-directed DNA polymerase
MVGRHCAVNGESCAQGEAHRSRSLHSTVAAIAAKSVDSKATPRKGRQEGGCVKSSNRQCISYVSPVYRRGGTKQGTEAGSWVEASIWTEHMLAALENGVKGGKWFSLIDKVSRLRTLRIAWRKVAANKGSAGVDGHSVKRFGHRAAEYLQKLSQALKSGSCRPQPIKRVEIAKGPGKSRPLGIPVVKDRIVQTALKMVIEPIFEKEFEESSYGFRPQGGCKDALREVDRLIKKGDTHVVDADLASYFDTIPHDGRMVLVQERISDGRILELIRGYLRQDVISDLKRWTPIGGTPQGAVISPLLANLYRHPLDRLMREKG